MLTMNSSPTPIRNVTSRSVYDGV